MDHQYIRIFHKDGRRKDIIDLGIQISKLEFCGESGHYVALVAPQELRVHSTLLVNYLSQKLMEALRIK